MWFPKLIIHNMKNDSPNTGMEELCYTVIWAAFRNTWHAKIL